MNKITKKLYLIVLSLGLSFGLKAQVIYEWSEVFDAGGIDNALLVDHDASSYRYIAGTIETVTGVRFYLRKYNYSGTRQWDRTGDKDLPGRILFIKRDGSLNTFLVCENLLINGYSILKYDSYAKQRWKKDFTEKPVGLEIDRWGRVYTGGQATGGFYARSYRNSDGKVRWARSENLGRQAAAMDIDISGNVYVGGVNGGASGFMSSDDMRIVKFGVSSYSFMWATNYNGRDNNRDNVHQVVVDKNSNVYVSGEINAYGSMGANICMAKFNSSGNFLWDHFVTSAGGPVSATDKFLMLDPSQNPVLVGRKVDFYNVSPTNITSRIFVTKLDRHTGDEIFLSYPDDLTYDNPDINETPVCCHIDEHGHVYVGGYGNQASSFFTDRRWMVTKVEGTVGYNPWIMVGNSTGNSNQVNDIWVSELGHVYLAVTEHNSNADFLIEKLTQIDGLLREAIPAVETDRVEAVTSLSVYPNPSSDKFKLAIPETDHPVDVYVFDVSAKLVKQYLKVSESFEFGDDLNQGMYFITIINGDERKMLKIIKTAN